MIIIIIVDRRTANIVYRKVYSLWYNMNDRCYNKNHKRYYLYGGRGVTVCKKWRTFDGFVEDIDSIEGFNLDLFLKGKIHLDKDSINIKNKVYCIEKCKFVSIQENNKYKPNQQKMIIGVAPNGKIYEFFNQSQFAKDHNLRQSCISDCLRGRCKTHKGWKFNFK